MTIAAAVAELETNYGTYGKWSIPGDPEASFIAGTIVAHVMNAEEFFQWNSSTPTVTVDSLNYAYCFDDYPACTGGIVVQWGVFEAPGP